MALLRERDRWVHAAWWFSESRLALRMNKAYDVAIIGGGIVGLSTGYQLAKLLPGVRLAILEKETELATHQSARNSGVIHAGVYYAPGSLKARLCREGRAELERYCETKGIPFDRCGKLIVATTREEVPRLLELRDRATANGVTVHEVGSHRMRDLEPHVIGLRGLWSPSTGITDFRGVAMALADDLLSSGVDFYLAQKVTEIRRRAQETILVTSRGDVVARNVIACAGLWADVVARMTGGAGPRIVPFRGDFYKLDFRGPRLGPGADLPGARSQVPVPRRSFHQADRRRGVGWAERRARLRP